MDEVAQPLVGIWVGVTGPHRHVECALPDEGAGVGRHVRQVVHHHKHLHHRPMGVEQSHLHRPFVWHVVPLFAQVNVALRESNCGVSN